MRLNSIKTKLEYIWLDKFQKTRSKVKITSDSINSIKDIGDWNFDGSSTGQAIGHDSDVFLKPVKMYRNPFDQMNSLLVLCECFDDPNHKIVNKANSRRELVDIENQIKHLKPLVGIEQEYVIYDRKTMLPFKWINAKTPGLGPQGPYYCSAGGDRAFGRDVVEEHMKLCLDTDLAYLGYNAEVLPSQWEFQIGTIEPLQAADDLVIARYIMDRVTEKYDLFINYDPKPVQGDWNGSGGHVNISTELMRENNGIDEIRNILKKLELKHQDAMKVYGEDNHFRLSGNHETSNMNKFTWGIGHRGASVRITKKVLEQNKGYFEDRRPASNLDPYKVLSHIFSTFI